MSRYRGYSESNWLFYRAAAGGKLAQGRRFESGTARRACTTGLRLGLFYRQWIISGVLLPFFLLRYFSFNIRHPRMPVGLAGKQFLPGGLFALSILLVQDRLPEFLASSWGAF
ncbi:MAG: hypothetical protein V8T87_13145 [Victivallales bacterium]